MKTKPFEITKTIRDGIGRFLKKEAGIRQRTRLLAVFGLAVLLAQHAATGAQSPVSLGTASSFAVLAGSGITVAGAVNTTTINGDIGTFPTTSETGLGNVVLNGVDHAGDAVTQGAKTDLTAAYLDAAGRTPVVTVASQLGGTTKTPGVYNSADGKFKITGTLTLDGQGDPDAVFIFITASSLITASSSGVTLTGSARAQNVFWVVGSSATLGTSSDFKGNILALTSITATTGATVTGRLLARNGTVTLDTNTISAPQLVIPVTLLFFRASTMANGVKLKWETATEFDNLGYNLYRAESARGVRTKINANLVPGANSLDGQLYKFMDKTAKPGVTYYYWLEEVAWNFETQTFGPAWRPATTTGTPQSWPLTLGTFRTTGKGGLYRIRYETLAAAGLPAGTLNADRLAVWVDGDPAPAFVEAEGAVLKPGDSLLFYAGASKKGLSGAVTVEDQPARMRLAYARPLSKTGDVYTGQAGPGHRVAFVTDPSLVRILLRGFTGVPVWLLDMTDPSDTVLLYGYSYVGLEDGETAVYLSYAPESGPAKCLAIQDEAVMDVPRMNRP